MTLLEIQERLIANCGERSHPPCFGAFSIAMRSPLKKVCTRRGAATLGRFETAPRLVRRATRSRSNSPRVHRRDLGFDEHGAQTRTLSARPKVMRRRSTRPLQDGYARRRPAPSRPRGAKGLRPADQRRLVRGGWTATLSRRIVLPPPHMNPIEKAYSKLKAFCENRRTNRRGPADRPRHLRRYTAECANYFEACGYDTG